MTELMKRYEETMDLKKDSIKMQYVYDKFIEGFEEFAQEEYDALQAENAQLKEQLRWRLVSERPEKDGWYLCKVLYVNDTIGEETVHFDGERFVFSNVVKWLPIPPAPEGE